VAAVAAAADPAVQAAAVDCNRRNLSQIKECPSKYGRLLYSIQLLHEPLLEAHCLSPPAVPEISVTFSLSNR